MRVDYRTNPGLGKYYMPIDLDTGKFIDFCLWSDDEAGEYCRYIRDVDGNIEREWGNPEYRHLSLEQWKTKKNEKYGGIIAKKRVFKGRIKNIDSRMFGVDSCCSVCNRMFENNILAAEHYIKHLLTAN